MRGAGGEQSSPLVAALGTAPPPRVRKGMRAGRRLLGAPGAGQKVENELAVHAEDRF